jgi:hypothetical protein
MLNFEANSLNEQTIQEVCDEGANHIEFFKQSTRHQWNGRATNCSQLTHAKSTIPACSAPTQSLCIFPQLCSSVMIRVESLYGRWFFMS